MPRIAEIRGILPSSPQKKHIGILENPGDSSFLTGTGES
jgi:hypothetical protein